MRSPRRTAQTSAALMVGLALVATIAVFGIALSQSATASVNDAVNADYIITSSATGGSGGFSDWIYGDRQRCPAYRMFRKFTTVSLRSGILYRL